MANQKISQMPPASLPLSGNELMPLVQGGINVQISVREFFQNICHYNCGDLDTGQLILAGSEIVHYRQSRSDTGQLILAGSEIVHYMQSRSDTGQLILAGSEVSQYIPTTPPLSVGNQGSSTGAAFGGFTYTWPTTTTAGDCLIIAVETANNITVIPLSGWSLVQSILVSGTTQLLSVFVSAAATAQSTTSFFWAGSQSYYAMGAEVFNSTNYDASVTSSGIGSTWSSGTTGTLAVTGEVGVAFLATQYPPGITGGALANNYSFNQVSENGSLLLGIAWSQSPIVGTSPTSTSGGLASSGSWAGAVVTFEN